MKRLHLQWLFVLLLVAVFSTARNASAQCPPNAPTGVNAVLVPSLTVSEGSSLLVSAVGGGPTFEWDTDCDGVTPSRGDGVFSNNFYASAVDRDGAPAASFGLCVRSINPNCPMGMQQSAQFRTTVSVTNVAPVIEINVLPNAQVGTPYNFIVTASDPANPPLASAVRDPFTWSATGLPMGLSINPSTGAITGTPAMGTEGVYNVRVLVSDGDGGTATADLPLNVVRNVSPALSCNDPLIASGAGGAISVNEGGVTMVSARPTGPDQCNCVIGWDLGCDGTTEYFGITYNLSAAGRDGPSATRLCARAYPAGVSVGLGAAVCVGASSTVSVNGMAGVPINNVPPTIVTSTLPNGTVGSPYTTVIEATDPANPPTASGIQDPFTWSAAGLPPGLMIDSATGTIFGTPTMAGTFTVRVTVIDGDGGMDIRGLTITISPGSSVGVCPTAVVVSSGVGGVLVAEGGSTTINAIFPTGSSCGCVIQWDVGCDGMPDGTGGSLTLSGVDRDGPSTFNVCHRTIPGSGGMCTQPSMNTTTAVTVTNVAPTITTAVLPTGTLGVPYMATLAASDPANPPIAMMVRDPITWSAAGLPPGLSLNPSTGVISGTPDSSMGAMARCYPVRFTANDGDGGIATQTIDLCLVAMPPMVCPTAMPSAPFTVPEGGMTSLSVMFAGGVDPCGCEVVWDLNCDGTVDATGLSTTFNAAGLDGPSTRQVCWFSRPAGGRCNAVALPARENLTVTNVAPTITTPSIPMGTEGVPYMTTISATDPANPPIASSVQDPLTWSITGAPMWLSIDPVTGTISGTPPSGTAGMSFTFTVSVRDDDGGMTSRPFTLTIVGRMMDGGTEAGTDGGDASVDGATDAGADASADGATDADADASDDGATDAAADASDDGAIDDAADASDDGAIDDAADASVDAATDDAADAGVVQDAASTDSGSMGRADSASGDGSSMNDGGITGGLSGDGACACRVPAAPSNKGRSPTTALLALTAVATAAVARRRRR
jgi:hypothetical protein